MNEIEQDRRNDNRPRAIRSGQMIYGFFSPTVIDCLVLEVSDIGARVETGVMVSVPDELSLRIGEEPRRRARRCWALGNQIGLEFFSGPGSSDRHAAE